MRRGWRQAGVWRPGEGPSSHLKGPAATADGRGLGLGRGRQARYKGPAPGAGPQQESVS
jgi:hypothetical protein